MRRASTPNNPSHSPPRRMKRGFVQTGGILSKQIRKASEKRGFAETRLLTHWTEIVGEATAKIAEPVKVSYNRQGIGASLTVYCTGANAPMLQMQLPQIIERVNACYGYSAISRIYITQTSQAGFADAGQPFVHKPEKTPLTQHDRQRLETTVSDVADESLRKALANLGENIITKPKTR